MRILVTGSREWTDSYAMTCAFMGVRVRGDVPVTLVHGGARGADELAGLVAVEFGWAVEEHPADWDRHGKAAGFIRNQEMVDAGADVCLAFFKEGAANRGTKDCTRRALIAGIPVRRIEG